MGAGWLNRDGRAHALMILGTHSGAGKSLLVTAFCRILARSGVKVAPFKAQNMSNNAGVTSEGGEMGRAQIVQAEACGVRPHTDMNPILLKPEADHRSQIILNGRVFGHMESRNWLDIKQHLWHEVRAAYDRLAARYEVIVLEGAGSPAEINLKQSDIVNLAMARHAGAPCLLVGDIDRGGVFAALAGTMLLLEPAERRQIQGFLINKFRGDPALLGDVNHLLQEKAFGVPTLGVVPYIPGLHIPDEDAVVLDQKRTDAESGASTEGMLDIAIIHLPHIANFDEFEALAAEPGVRVHFVRDPDEFGHPDAVILPGTKSTLADLFWLRNRGLDRAVVAAAAEGRVVTGICGGYQMLGRYLVDELGIEGPAGQSALGLDLLPLVTVFTPHKATHPAQLQLADGQIVDGYEIHAGVTERLDGAAPLGIIIRRGDLPTTIVDGAIAADGKVWGTYLHGIFANELFRHQWLGRLGWRGGRAIKPFQPMQDYDRLADKVEAAVDWPRIAALIELEAA